MVFKKKTATENTSISPIKAKSTPKSDKDQVKTIHKKSVCKEIKTGFVIFDKPEKGKALHSGIARSESDAWKLANHAVK